MNILVTGASGGVGFEIVLAFILKDEHRVIALARSEDKLQKLRETALILNPNCSIYPKKFDIIHDDYNSQLIPFIKKHLGFVDILINNAGALVHKAFEELSELDFTEMFEHNFLGHVKMIQRMLPHFNEHAHIVNIGSMGAFQGSVKFPRLIAYAASKAALHNLTECLAVELQDYKQMKVNCLAFGSVETDMLKKAFPDYQSPIMASEMGKYVADFALNGHRFFNGKIIPVALTTP